MKKLKTRTKDILQASLRSQFGKSKRKKPKVRPTASYENYFQF